MGDCQPLVPVEAFAACMNVPAIPGTQRVVFFNDFKLA
jgi:hypothetical protein